SRTTPSPGWSRRLSFGRRSFRRLKIWRVRQDRRSAGKAPSSFAVSRPPLTAELHRFDFAKQHARPNLSSPIRISARRDAELADGSVARGLRCPARYVRSTRGSAPGIHVRSEEHTSELQSREN